MPSANDLATHWALDPDVVFLNHGSFGATPRAVLELQSELRARMEAEPVRFFLRELAPMLDEARAFIGAFLGADADDNALVRNATAGVNAVLRSLRLEPGDELLLTDHAYGACRNAVEHVAALAGARVVVAEVSFPPRDAASIVADRSPMKRTRLSSPTMRASNMIGRRASPLSSASAAISTPISSTSTPAGTTRCWAAS